MQSCFSAAPQIKKRSPGHEGKECPKGMKRREEDLRYK